MRISSTSDGSTPARLMAARAVDAASSRMLRSILPNLLIAAPIMRTGRSPTRDDRPISNASSGCRKPRLRAKYSLLFTGRKLFAGTQPFEEGAGSARVAKSAPRSPAKAGALPKRIVVHAPAGLAALDRRALVKDLAASAPKLPKVEVTDDLAAMAGGRTLLAHLAAAR